MFKRGLIAFILIAAAGAAFWYWRSAHADEAPDISTVALTRGSITQSVTASGTIQPVTSVEVSSQISGLINEVLVDFNSPVTQGQVLARIDPATYQQHLRQAQADLASSEANLHLVEINAQRTRELFNKAFMTKQDLDAAVAQVEQAKADVQIKEANLQGAKVDFDRCTIRSPITGVVMDREVDVGKTVAASFNAPTLFIIANQLTDMEIDASVAEADVGNVTNGQDVDFTVDAYPNRHFHGKVTQVRNNPKTTNNVVTYDTMISVKNADLKLMSGMTADVSIVVARHKDALRIPNSALRARIPEELITSHRQLPADSDHATVAAPVPKLATNAKPMTADERRRATWQIFREVGFSRSSPPTADQLKRAQELAAAQGFELDLSRFASASGNDSNVSTRTVFRLLPSADPTKPRIEAVQVKLGISDGIYTEVLAGLTDNDKIITSVTLPTSQSGSNTANPFAGPRFGHR